MCDYDFHPFYANVCFVNDSEEDAAQSGNCDLDVDECLSAPCINGGRCTESTTDSVISYNSYRCTCIAGFMNGVCDYDFRSEYTAECSVWESDDNGHDASLSGNCDIDVDECESSPCQNGATCTDSNVESRVSVHAYQCACVAGFANGVCEYDFIAEYTTECTVMESIFGADCRLLGVGLVSCGTTCVPRGSQSTSMAHSQECQQHLFSGNCDIDVNECASSPCQNGATCTESNAESSVSIHAYQCTCVAGFANGVCEYDFIAEYTTECTVMESDDHSGTPVLMSGWGAVSYTHLTLPTKA